MFGLGTIINTAAVVSGGFIGVALKRGIPKKCSDVLMQGCGVATIFIGAGGVLQKMLTVNEGRLETQGSMLLILSLVIGGLIGSLIDIEGRLDKLGEILKKRFGSDKDNLFVEGFVNCTLVICIGAMAIIGAIQDGLTGDCSVLAAKAVLDFVIVIVFASTLGKGVIFSALPLFIYQGAITCIAALSGDFMSAPLTEDISFVGSALIFCVGVNVGFGKKFAVGNLLPALFVPIVYHIIPRSVSFAFSSWLS